MKLKRSVYDILQYLSTISEIFVYRGDNLFIMKDKAGSSFTEVEVKDFFNEQVIIRSLPKFLRLFTFPKPGRNDTAEPESIQEWTLEDHVNDKHGRIEHQMILREPHHITKVVQGGERFLEQHVTHKRYDDIHLDNALRFQIDRTQYKQILADCSLLDLDVITIKSLDEHTIQIALSKKDSTNNYDTSTYEIECDHQHEPTKVTIMLSTFGLIDASDHQIEVGIYRPTVENAVPIMKVKSFYTSDLIVKRLIIGIKGDY